MNVVITGSTQGLGAGYAREFLKRGHSVMVSGRKQASVDKAVSDLRRIAPSGARVAGVACDVSRIEDVQALWDASVRELGRVDLWFNNAGYARTGVTFLETRPAELAAMVRSNVIGTMNGCQVALAGMKAQGANSGNGGWIYLTLGGGAKGRIVPGMAVYSTTKRALKYFADCLVKEARGTAVKIGTVSPGINITEGMLREIEAVTPAARARMLRPLNLIGDHVETTTPWIVERILEGRESGHDVTWLTGGRMMQRLFGSLFRKRDVLSRYGLRA